MCTEYQLSLYFTCNLLRHMFAVAFIYKIILSYHQLRAMSLRSVPLAAYIFALLCVLYGIPYTHA